MYRERRGDQGNDDNVDEKYNDDNDQYMKDEEGKEEKNRY